jgi:hypothetical protein
MKVILDEEWVATMTSECAEAMTLHLLSATNPDGEGNDCGCLTCLARLCVEIVLTRIHDESELQMMQENHKQKVDRRNIN